MSKKKKAKVSNKPDSSLAGIGASAQSAEFVPSISDDKGAFIDSLNEVYDFIPNLKTDSKYNNKK